MPKILPVGAVAAVTLALGATAATAFAAAGSAAAAAPRPAVSAHSAKATLHTATVSVGSKHQTIVVTASGRPVYLLTGDSPKHPQCASSCRGVWPAVTGAHPTGRGITGKLGVWHHNGISQVTLDGHPLYTYVADSGPTEATGEGVHSFGGVWYVLAASGAEIATDTASTTTASTPAPYGY